MLPAVRATIEAWYKKLAFPDEYDTEFYTYLDTVEIDPNVTAETYGEDADGAKNFLTYLYCCEELKRRYEEKGSIRRFCTPRCRSCGCGHGHARIARVNCGSRICGGSKKR